MAEKPEEYKEESELMSAEELEKAREVTKRMVEKQAEKKLELGEAEISALEKAFPEKKKAEQIRKEIDELFR
jgi:hypothetical protein